MRDGFRRKLSWVLVPAVLIGGLTASGLAWAQTTAPPPSGSAVTTPRVFFAISPTRILDTRYALGTSTAGPLGANSKIDLQVAGVGPVPANATGAAVSVTVFGTDTQSFLTVWPSGQAQPGTSLLNPQPGLILSQAASIGLGTDGKLSIYNAVGATQVVVDLVGYYQDTQNVPSLANAAHFLTGTADPGTDQGLVGDMFINNTSNTLFGPKSASGWGSGTRLGGAMFSTGIVDPATTVGSLGDMYINTANNTLFGPKTTAGWGTGNPMGSHYTTGTSDPTAAIGIVGDIYLNTATNVLFGPKTTAGWGTGASLAPAGQTAAQGANFTLTATNIFTSVPAANITLPPGKWLVQAKGLGFYGGTSTDITFRLRNLTTGSDLDSIHLVAGTNASLPFALGNMVTLTAQSQIDVQVYSATLSNAENVKIWATPLSSINGA